MADFKSGDVVVCVDDGPSRLSGHVFVRLSAFVGERLRKGAIYRVVKTVSGSKTGVLGLWLEGRPCPEGSFGVGAYRFRHLPKADEQFTASMRALKPVKGKQDA